MGNSLMDTYVQVFANRSVWMESAAIEQLHTTASNLAGIRAAVGLPDLHPGRGYPVGAAFFSVERFYPALVGGDIGCGMALHATDLRVHKTSPSKLEKALGHIDGLLPDELLAQVDEAVLAAMAAQSGVANLAYLQQSLGTIGGGNHFAELQAVDSIYEEGVLDKKQVYLMVHSGSRGLGGAILRAHVDRFNHAGLAAGSAEADEYWRQHAAAIAYARLNRQMIAQRMAKALRCALLPVLDITHNHVQSHDWRGAQGFLTARAQHLPIRGWWSFRVRAVTTAIWCGPWPSVTRPCIRWPMARAANGPDRTAWGGSGSAFLWLICKRPALTALWSVRTAS